MALADCGCSPPSHPPSPVTFYEAQSGPWPVTPSTSIWLGLQAPSFPSIPPQPQPEGSLPREQSARRRRKESAGGSCLRRPPNCSAARGPQKVLLQKGTRRGRIHSFRKHGASPSATARVTLRCIRMGPGPPATAPPPLPLRRTCPLAPSSRAPHLSPRRTDSSSPSEGTCGTNKERG